MNIKERAKEFNAQYPEAAAEIDAGTAVIDVSYQTDGSGWNVTLVATAGVRTDDGGFIAAVEPEVTTMRRPGWAAQSGGAEKLAAWWGRRTFPVAGAPAIVRKVGI